MTLTSCKEKSKKAGIARVLSCLLFMQTYLSVSLNISAAKFW